jgi:hypothetical protein
MKLSSAMFETLKAFNGLDPVSRPGLFPIRDGASFHEKVMKLAGKGLVLGRASKPLETVAEHMTPAVESVRVDPYSFSPPDMDMS